MPVTVHIENASGSDDVPDEPSVRSWILAALTHQQKDHAELSVRIVDEEEMTSLNTQYRQQNKSTNVLSFPADIPPELEIQLLGDLAVCAPVITREAREQGKSGNAHWAHMLVHGTLHLLGYDHIEDADADTMETIETTIIAELGFPPPYDEQPTMLERENN